MVAVEPDPIHVYRLYTGNTYLCIAGPALRIDDHHIWAPLGQFELTLTEGFALFEARDMRFHRVVNDNGPFRSDLRMATPDYFSF